MTERTIGKLYWYIVAVFSLCATNHLNAEPWPQYRGPAGQGISSETGLPIRWSKTENVAWKTSIPGRGWSSPIVWDEYVIVTATEDDRSCRVIALDLKSGAVRWNQEVLEIQPGHKHAKNSYATSTPATDGKLIYAAFADGSIVALDYQGQTIWKNRDVRFHSQHGLAASPIVHKGLLLISFDGSSSEDEKIGFRVPWEQGFLWALDKNTGKECWRGRRGPSRLAHNTPIVIDCGTSEQVVSPAGDVVQGFDFATGRRLWSVFSKGHGCVPSCSSGNGLVYSSSGFEAPTIRAIRPTGQGDVTKTHIAWETTVGVPRMASFVCMAPHLFSVTDQGVVYCFDAASGEVLGKQRIGGNHSAAPVCAEGHLYFLDDSGACTIVAANPDLSIIAQNAIGQHCQASLAISNGSLLIRSETDLWSIRRGDSKQE